MGIRIALLVLVLVLVLLAQLPIGRFTLSATSAGGVEEEHTFEIQSLDPKQPLIEAVMK